MSELSGAESDARQAQRPNESDSDNKNWDRARHHPGPPVSGDQVGFKEAAAAEADSARMDEALTEPPAGAQ
jgi:hypothetical protein